MEGMSLSPAQSQTSSVSTHAFARTTSCILTGGASIVPASGDLDGAGVGSAPLIARQDSRRVLDAQAVRNRVNEEARDNVSQGIRQLTPRILVICFLASLMLGLMVGFFFYMCCVAFNLIYVSIWYGNLPCDQPLHLYLLLNIVARQVAQIVQRFRGNEGSALLTHMIDQLPSLCVFWGLYMINNCRTCPKTNPELFYATQLFVYAQLIAITLTCVCFSIFCCCANRIMLQLSTLGGNAGCPEAVQKLPKVSRDSAELVDPEDNKIKNCCICWESFSGPGDILRTPCNHFFHASCLTKWCQGHQDCPLCRALIPEDSGVSS